MIAAAALGAACGKGGDVVEPNGNGNAVLDGIALSAEVVEITHTVTSVVQVTMQVTLRNTTSAAITRSYPAGCPVRMRFYDAQTLTLVYDEGQRPCPVTTPVQFTIQPQESMMLATGVRFPWDILGDSLASAAYYAAALVRITGLNPIEVDAGVYAIPHCEELPVGTVCY
jgi:hypothetical protein